MTSYKPTVGDGATICVGSDRYPCTIVQIVSRGPGRAVVWLKRDGTERRHRVSLRKDGKWRESKTDLLVYLGERELHLDPSF